MDIIIVSAILLFLIIFSIFEYFIITSNLFIITSIDKVEAVDFVFANIINVLVSLAFVWFLLGFGIIINRYFKESIITCIVIISIGLIKYGLWQLYKKVNN